MVVGEEIMFNDVLVLRKEAKKIPTHIRVEFHEEDDWDDYVPVMVNYRLRNGRRIKTTAHQIRNYKALGLLL